MLLFRKSIYFLLISTLNLIGLTGASVQADVVSGYRGKDILSALFMARMLYSDYQGRYGAEQSGFAIKVQSTSYFPERAGSVRNDFLLEMQSLTVDDAELVYLCHGDDILFHGISTPWLVDQTLPERILASERFSLNQERGRARRCSGIDSFSDEITVQTQPFDSGCRSRFTFILDINENGYLVIVVAFFNEEGKLSWKAVTTGHHTFTDEGQQLLWTLQQFENVILLKELATSYYVETLLAGSSEFDYSGESETSNNDSLYSDTEPAQVKINGSSLFKLAAVYNRRNESESVPGMNACPRIKGGAGYGRSIHVGHTQAGSTTTPATHTKSDIDSKNEDRPSESKAAEKNRKKRERKRALKIEREEKEAPFLKTLEGHDINDHVIKGFLTLKKEYMTDDQIADCITGLHENGKISETAYVQLSMKLSKMK